MTRLTLDLTDKEIEYLRNSTSDLGTEDKIAVTLQLKIVNAILDSPGNNHFKTPVRVPPPSENSFDF